MTQEVLGEAAENKEKQVTLPHDAMIEEKRAASHSTGTGGGFFPGADYEYTRTLHVDADEKSQSFFLEFEGIYNRGYIFVNEELMGRTQYGYTGKIVDITPALRFGEDNVICVRAVNTDAPNSRWYTGSGIFRPVWLYKGGDVRIEARGLRVSTPEVSPEVAAVKVETAVRYDGKAQKYVQLKTEILDASGQVVTEDLYPVTLFAADTTKVTRRLYVQSPALWSTEEPNLYRCRVTICEAEQLLDCAETSFGIRQFTLDPVHGLRLNGQEVLLRGACIHHDNGPVGAATFARAEERRVEILKEAGFNSIRVAHNSSSVALLDACDRLGMLVMEESYDVWTKAKTQFDSSLIFTDSWEEDLEDIVSKDFNHPSVFMYSIGNEIQDLGKPEGRKWNRRLAEKVRALDPTRYVTNAVNPLMIMLDNLPMVLVDLGMLTPEQLQAMASGEGGGDINDMMTMLLGKMNELSAHSSVERELGEVFSALDLVGVNYSRGAYEKMSQNPNLIFYGSETCPPDIDLNWKCVKETPANLGDYTWTAWDYIGEAGVGIVTYDGKLRFAKGYPAYLAYCGDIDITGFRRPISYYREVVFGLRRKPYIAVRLPEHYNDQPMCTPWSLPDSVSSWTWNGYEGKPCRVEVYSDAPQVELFVNGKSAGTLPCGEENRFRAIFETTYEPGEICAKACYVDGKTECFTLNTASEDLKIVLEADRSELCMDDLSYVTIELRDRDGNLMTCSDRKVAMKIEGPGCIQGFGSADPMSEENFFDAERTTWYGRLIAVVRAGEEQGTIRLTAEAEGLEVAVLELKVG